MLNVVPTNKEDEKTKDFLFEFINENGNIMPSFCMADAAKATSKSLEKILGSKATSGLTVAPLRSYLC